MDNLNSKKQNVLWMTVSICVALFFLVKYTFPFIISNLYQSESLSALNFLSQSTSKEALGFYLGRIEEVFYGPLMMILSGLALALFYVFLFPSASTRTFFFITMGYLLLTRPEVMFYPPYGDAIGGPFAEAIWLVRNNFDYIGLSKQPDYISGGPKVYLFSIYPTYLAALMKAIPHTKTFFFVNHLLVFIMGALSVAQFRKLCLKRFDGQIAGLLSVLLVSLPLFQSQVEAINMEIPTLFFFVMATVALVERKINIACVYAVLASMVKGYAVIVCGSVFLGSVLLFFWGEKNKGRISTLLWGVTAFVFVAFKVYADFYILSEEGNVDMVGPFQGWPSLKIFGITYAYVLSFLIFVGYLFREKFSRRKEMSAVIRENFIDIVMFLTAGGWFFLFLHSYSVSPRYRIILLPFMVYSFYFPVQLFIKNQKFCKTAIALFATFYFFSAYGFMDKPIQENDHVLLERSLEYRNDLKVNMKLTKEIESKYANLTIGAPQNIAQQLAIPEMGYVTKKLKVMIYGFKCTYADVTRFDGLKGVDIRNTIWIGVKSSNPMHTDYSMYPGRDRLVQEVIVGNKRAKLFVGGFGLELLKRTIDEYKRRYIKKIIANPEKYQRAFQFKDKETLKQLQGMLESEEDQ